MVVEMAHSDGMDNRDNDSEDDGQEGEDLPTEMGIECDG